MGLSEAMALVVRQRGGPNLVVHTRGISGMLVNRACEEAVTIMGRFALGRGLTDVDGTGDIHPKFSHDKLLVLNGRYAVVYRLVYRVWVMAVTAVHSSALIPVRLVETATKGLVTTCQILEVDSDIIARNYAEVHFMMGAILKYLGADLQKAQAEALANIYSFIADTREKKSKGTDSSKRVSVQHGSHPTLEGFGEQEFDFNLPPDFKRLHQPTAIPKPSGFAFNFSPSSKIKPSETSKPSDPSHGFDLTDLNHFVSTDPKSHQAEAPSNFTGLDNLLDGPTPTQPTAITSTPSFDLFASNPSPPQPTVPPVPTVEPQPASDWFDFTAMPKPSPLPAAPQPHTGGTHVQNITPAFVTSPVKSGPLLYLTENWEGIFEGQRCTRSSTTGEVNLRKSLWKRSVGKHSILNNETSPWLRGIKTLMKCVKRNTARTTLVKNGIFSAKVKPAPMPYLKYNLLPGSYDIPVHVCVTSGVMPFKHHPQCVILMIHVSTNPRNKSVMHGGMFVWLPRMLEAPVYARPNVQYSQNQRCLKWILQPMQPNQKILYKVVLPTSGSMDEDIAKSVRVQLNGVGVPGVTFSDVSVAQEQSPGTDILLDTPMTSVWTASVTARP